ncbi:hypothetical protein DINM_006682 [Dirofilaria immitis]|nr:hypothetical protein [Dirofilaria immitis]
MFDSCFPPLRMCLECVQGPSFSVTQSNANFQNEPHSVRLDTVFMGDDVVLLKTVSEFVVQEQLWVQLRSCRIKLTFKSVFNKLVRIWGIGVATRSADLNSVPVIASCWVVRQDGQIVANGEVLGKLDELIDEGDCIGVAFDHIELKFYKNGVLLPLSISNVKGQVYPIIYVGDNAILDVAFHLFSYNAPEGYEEIMLEQTIL